MMSKSSIRLAAVGILSFILNVAQADEPGTLRIAPSSAPSVAVPPLEPTPVPAVSAAVTTAPLAATMPPPAAASHVSPTWSAFRQFSLNNPSSRLAIRGYIELGTVGVVEHKIQQGSDGTLFDLRTEAGQNSLFFFTRLSAEIEIYKRHTFILLYQPIDLRTEATLRRDIRSDGLDFPAGTPMKFRYGFDFYRLSYLYDFIKNPLHELSLGLSLQLRVANVEFTSLDGRLQRTSQNIGPVPIIKLRGRYTFPNSAFLGFEIDGIGIQFPSETGSVLGLLFDASVRAGYSPTNFMEVFLNLRYLGGGARGPGQNSDFSDGYIDNFLHTLVGSIGIGIK